MTKLVAPKVRVAYRPVIRKGGEAAHGEADNACGESGATGAGCADEVFARKPRSPRSDHGVAAADPNAAFFRAANEDDDGYDPYSDRQEIRPMFEEDPWS